MARRILLVGNFLSHARTHRHYCEDLADRLELAGLQVHRTSRHPGRVRKLADMLQATWRRRHDYDVAHVDLFSSSAFAWAEVVCFELRRLGKPYVITMHGGNLPELARRWPRRVRRLLASASHVTSPSPYLQEAMTPYVRDVSVIPNGLDISRYMFDRREQPSDRLVWLRAFHRLYNPVMAVEVLAALHRRRPSTTLRMIGPDRHDGSVEEVRRRARELGVEGQLDIVGPVPNGDVPSQLASSDVFLNTSNADNTPISMLEAMASGLCVVSTSVGGVPYIAEHEREALLVPPGNAAAAAAAVERLSHEVGLASRLSAAARARAESYDWPVVVARWTTLFDQVAARA